MNTDYPVELFLRHQELWTEKYSKASRLEFSDGTTVIVGKDKSNEAVVLRVRHMMLQEGADSIQERFYGKVFHMSWIFWVQHEHQLFKAGWIRLSDGVNAILREELLRALHRFFCVSPVPTPGKVSLKDVIDEANRIQQKREQSD